jgi:hypothetical protein
MTLAFYDKIGMAELVLVAGGLCCLALPAVIAVVMAYTVSRRREQ